MTEAELIVYMTTTMGYILYFSLPSILAATFFGVLISMIQALTQIQEQNLAFAVKLVVIIFVIYITTPWMSKEIKHFTITMLNFSSATY